MKLKQLNHYLDFMDAVKRCEDEVYFNSDQGDHLNLKSTLSQFLFAAICTDHSFLAAGEIECRSEGDYERLGAFLQ